MSVDIRQRSAAPPAEGKLASTEQGIELRSIDWVPHSERHGKVWHIFPVWFSGNAELTTFITGAAAITLGGNLIWTMIGLAVGTIFGTFFSAFHSAQGPQLGLPQMIQSRPQFGYLGVAVMVLPAAWILYSGYNIYNGLLPAQALDNVTGHHVDTKVWLPILAVVGFAAALWGYDLIHRTQRYLTWGFIVFFSIYTIGVLATLKFPHGAFSLSGFKEQPFLVSVLLTLSYQIGWAPYVSDYSRYLPASVGIKAAFHWTYWAMVISGIWLFWIGAIVVAPVAAHAPFAVDTIRHTGDALFSGWGAIVLVMCVPALVMILAMNMYGGMLTLVTMVDSFKPLRPRLAHRVVGLAITLAAGLIGGYYANSSATFYQFYTNLLLVLLYLIVPWTAVNLIDYYLVRRGHYAIKEIFNPHGLYGRWGWRGLIAYFAGFGASAPFWVLDAGPKADWYIGPVAKIVGSASAPADISPFVGLPVSAAVYLILARTLDLARERKIEEEEGEFTAAELAEHGAAI
jgi:NCS1 family nucleobase:cation symporter-1